MQTETEIRSCREILMNKLKELDSVPEDRYDRYQVEVAQNLIHTLTWVLDNQEESKVPTLPPYELLGYSTFRFTAKALEVIRFTEPDRS